jgi:hypothetical protein
VQSSRCSSGLEEVYLHLSLGFGTFLYNNVTNDVGVSLIDKLGFRSSHISNSLIKSLEFTNHKASYWFGQLISNPKLSILTVWDSGYKRKDVSLFGGR